MARAFLILEAMQDEMRQQERRKSIRLRRKVRENARALEISDQEFKAHYRLNKEAFRELCSELSPLLTRPRRKTTISVECKILTALSFYASGSYQKPMGNSFLHGLSQSSVSNCVREVTLALNNLIILRKYIKFPQNYRERQRIINGFFDKFGIPGVLGCVDGSHVALIKPTEHEERFFNRKHYHSRNVQIVCDSDLNILNVDASFGGAAHDAHVWRSCELNYHLQQLHRDGQTVWFLGDSGYPLRPWLLTPITNAESGTPEENYTRTHTIARNTVERCIGVLKSRWRCLLSHRVLHYDHHLVAKIVNACSVLHNICNKYRISIPDLLPEDLHTENRLQIPRESPHDEDHDLLQMGRQQRQLIIERLWRNRH